MLHPAHRRPERPVQDGSLRGQSTHPWESSDHPPRWAPMSRVPITIKLSRCKQTTRRGLTDWFSADSMRGAPWNSSKSAAPIADLKQEASPNDKWATRSWPVVYRVYSQEPQRQRGLPGHGGWEKNAGRSWLGSRSRFVGCRGFRSRSGYRGRCRASTTGGHGQDREKYDRRSEQSGSEDVSYL